MINYIPNQSKPIPVITTVQALTTNSKYIIFYRLIGSDISPIPFLIKILSDKRMHVALLIESFLIKCMKRQLPRTSITLQGTFTHVKQLAQVLIVK